MKREVKSFLESYMSVSALYFQINIDEHRL